MSRGFTMGPADHQGGGLITSSPGKTMNFWTGPNQKYSRDSAWTPPTCLQQEILLSGSLSNQLYSVQISFLPPTLIKIPCKQHIQALLFVIKKDNFILWQWGTVLDCCPNLCSLNCNSETPQINAFVLF